MKVLDTTNYDSEIKKYKKKLFDDEVIALKRKNSCETLKGDIIIFNKEIKELEESIKSAPTEIIEIENIRASNYQ